MPKSTDKTPLSVADWPLDKIHPYAKNPRHNDAAVDAVAASISKFGWRQPIVVDGNGVIIMGHTRLKAAQKLGLATAPVHVAADLDPAKVKALRLADNKTAELATWDFDLLNDELAGLADLGGDFDMGEFGFPDFGEGFADTAPQDAPEPTRESAGVSTDIGSSALPQELQGQPLAPTPVQDFTGDGKTLMERVIIVYPKAREADIAALLGLDGIAKVVYPIEEVPSLASK